MALSVLTKYCEYIVDLYSKLNNMTLSGFPRKFPEAKNFFQFSIFLAAPWRKRLVARLPPPGFRVRVSVSPCGYRGGRNGVWVGFFRGFSRFPLPQISFNHFSILILLISFHFSSSATVMMRSAGILATHWPSI